MDFADGARPRAILRSQSRRTFRRGTIVRVLPVKQVALLGDHNPSYLTHREIDAAVELWPPHVRARWVGTDTAAARRTPEADALWVVPGSPYRNSAVVYEAISAARTGGQPFLGTCGGFQYAVVEFARQVAGLPHAAHAETSPGASLRVVDRLPCSLVGQERLVTAVPGTRLHALCGDAAFFPASIGATTAWPPAMWSGSRRMASW